MEILNKEKLKQVPPVIEEKTNENVPQTPPRIEVPPVIEEPKNENISKEEPIQPNKIEKNYEGLPECIKKIEPLW